MKYHKEREFELENGRVAVIVSHDDPGPLSVSVKYRGNGGLVDEVVRTGYHTSAFNYPSLATLEVRAMVISAYRWIDTCPFYFTIVYPINSLTSNVQVTASLNNRYHTMKRLVLKSREVSWRIREHANFVGMPYYALYREYVEK